MREQADSCKMASVTKLCPSEGKLFTRIASALQSDYKITFWFTYQKKLMKTKIINLNQPAE